MFGRIKNLLPLRQKDSIKTRVAKNQKNPKLKKISKSSDPNLQKLFKTKNQKTDKSKEIRVFKPKKVDLLKSKITTKNQKEKRFLFGFKNYTGKDRLKPQNLKDTVSKSINFLLAKFQVYSKARQYVWTFSLIGFIVFTFYLSFFDTYFLLQKYHFIFPKDSHLSVAEQEKVVVAINKNRLWFSIPYNQFWFANDISLTRLLQSQIPQIEKVSVERRVWPDEIYLEIETEPILTTLGLWEVSEKKYWRVAKNGDIITADDANLNEELVFVQTPISFEAQNPNQVDFQDYSFANNPTQLNRLWFISWLRSRMEQIYGLQVAEVSVPTLFDQEVIITTSTGVKLFFTSDTQGLSREALTDRIDWAFLNSSLRDLVRDGELSYMDFRSNNKRILICYKDEIC